ncbi:ABC transporter six-transmembrane domain-containing protein [Pseudoalteromonas aurantia]|uniref:ABC transmembrane type-1 domain-containing protein n=1 Tax=Pseudoalteromonas aurantia 208 TaxID=1314867 RepID=A0ABR9EAJ2_9GAMM|nr:ABC transporter six-transmembrane domain-containing protein [Pseudoalteromonas aurantia]MBE0367787.1 hypothetical protein [Pseudoalteromonas aurantia 208]
MTSVAPISLYRIITANKTKVTINAILTIVEITLTALVPMFIGFAIDGLLAKETTEMFVLVAILISLIVMSVIRRFYDTRAYGEIRVKVQAEFVKNNASLSTSVLNARLDMVREFVDFLEESVPEILNAVIQFIVSLVVLYFLNPMLAIAALCSGVMMLLIYTLFHGNFYILNGAYNKQSERQVTILNTGSVYKLVRHFNYLKELEIKLSDREAILYGSVFMVLLSMVVFNLWYATLHGAMSAGVIFSIVSYSFEFVEAAIVLPMTLQSWSRLTEITNRINSTDIVHIKDITD